MHLVPFRRLLGGISFLKASSLAGSKPISTQEASSRPRARHLCVLVVLLPDALFVHCHFCKELMQKVTLTVDS